MREKFICEKNTILIVTSALYKEDKALFGIKAKAGENFYDKLVERFNKAFSNATECKVHFSEFKPRKGKGKITMLVNTGGGSMPYHFFEYKIEKIELV